ncbi:MAG: AAA family ATPase [Candidatus Hodarchaeota archaeon]
MVFCELVESLTEDYGRRILRIPQEVMNILEIDDETIIEVISQQGKRIGVIACLDHLTDYQGKSAFDESSPAAKRAPDKVKTDESEKGLPKPQGITFQGLVEIDNENVYPARLDGEVRLSLGINIGDLIEVDTILPPSNAKTVFFSVLGREPSLFSQEEYQLLFDQLCHQVNLPLSAGLITSVNFAFKKENVLIQATDPDGIVVCNKDTFFQLNETFVPLSKPKPQEITWEHIGGQKNIIHRIRKLVELPIRRPEVFNTINITPPKGILLEGPSGVGKTLVLEALAHESGATVIRPPSDLFAGIGPTEKNIRNLFQEVKIEARKSPVLLLLDNINTLTPAPYLNQPEYVRRFSVQFALGMDTLKGSNVIIIGACHSADDIDPIMRRPGRFDIEIELTVPTEKERLEILQIQLRTVPLDNIVTENLLSSYANRMTGYTGADIAAFVKEACMRAVSRYSDLFSVWRAQIPPSILRMIKVIQEDFDEAFKAIEPSALRSIHSKVLNPNVRWSNIGGLHDTKNLLQEQIEWQFKNPKVLEEMGVKPSGGMLLYGPPGNGKTLLAKALATELQASFISVRGPELLSVWFGESAKIIRELFNRAKKLAPCIVFFDEIDAMVPRRGVDNTEGGREIDATVNQLLTLLDGIDPNHGIFVLGATNRPGALDLALLRPGRLDRLVLIPSPNEKARKEILKIHTQNTPIEGDLEELLTDLAKRTQHFSGADLENLCREAVLASLRDDFKRRIVSKEHFEEAITKVSPSVDPQLEKYYDKFATEIIGTQRKKKFPKSTYSYG